MTRKSYKLIADTIEQGLKMGRAQDNAMGVGYVMATRDIADNLASILKLDNPKFDRDKFLTACGF